MNKRGQIFLAAALIIAIILLSFGLVHNSAYSSKTDNRIKGLAKEIKYEGLRVIDYGVSQGASFAEISELLNQTMANYSSLNPDIVLFSWVYSPFEDEESKFFYNKGISESLPSEINVTKSPDLKYILIRWKDSHRNIYYNLSMNNRTYNFNVLVERGNNNEKIIAAE